MEAMLAFLTAILTPDILPELAVPMEVLAMAPVLLYTDASFHWGPSGEPLAVLERGFGRGCGCGCGFRPKPRSRHVHV